MQSTTTIHSVRHDLRSCAWVIKYEDDTVISEVIPKGNEAEVIEWVTLPADRKIKTVAITDLSAGVDKGRHILHVGSYDYYMFMRQARVAVNSPDQESELMAIWIIGIKDGYAAYHIVTHDSITVEPVNLDYVLQHFNTNFFKPALPENMGGK